MDAMPFVGVRTGNRSSLLADRDALVDLQEAIEGDVDAIPAHARATRNLAGHEEFAIVRQIVPAALVHDETGWIAQDDVGSLATRQAEMEEDAFTPEERTPLTLTNIDHMEEWSIGTRIIAQGTQVRTRAKVQRIGQHSGVRSRGID